MEGGGDGGDHTLSGRPVVGRVDVDAYGDPVGMCVHGRSGRAESLGQHDGRTAVQQAVGLGVSADRHGRDDAVGAGLDELDAHLLVEVAHREGPQEVRIVAHGVIHRAIVS